MSRIKPLALLFLLSLLLSCNQTTLDEKRVPVLEVEGRFLYLDQIREVLPPNVSEDDSILIADSYIQKWVTDVLLYENAKRNITDKAEIERLMDDYRKSLIIHQYQQRLMQERLSDGPSEKQMVEFYNTYSSQFILKETVMKGILLVVPREAPKMANVRSWVQSGSEKSLEQIEKYSIQHALSYDYFADRWASLSEVMRKIPILQTNPGDYLKAYMYYEISDSAKHYMLGVDSILLPGSKEPFEMARPRISSIILNKQQSEFITVFQDELYKDAIENGTISFFNK